MQSFIWRDNLDESALLSAADQDSVTAVDILLEPDETMIRTR